jgi:hypothetical protein
MDIQNEKEFMILLRAPCARHIPMTKTAPEKQSTARSINLSFLSTSLTIMVVVAIVSDWDDVLAGDCAPTAVDCPSINAYIQTGEFVELKVPVTFRNQPYCYGRVLSAAPLKLQLLRTAASLDVPPHEDITPPDTRQYVKYPKEIVSTNLVATVSPNAVSSEVFVFTPHDIETSRKGISWGMSNAFCIRYSWNSGTQELNNIAVEEFNSFPYERESFSKRAWAFAEKCHYTMVTALSKRRT